MNAVAISTNEESYEYRIKIDSIPFASLSMIPRGFIKNLREAGYFDDCTGEEDCRHCETRKLLGVRDSTCPTCKGTGEVPDEETD